MRITGTYQLNGTTVVTEHYESLLDVSSQAAGTNAMRGRYEWLDMGLVDSTGGGRLTADVARALDEGRTTKLVSLTNDFADALQIGSGLTARANALRPRRVRCRGDMGNELDEHAARAGRHDVAWSRLRREYKAMPSRQAVIHVGITAAAMTDSQKCIWRSACAVKLYRLLQSAGYSVEIVVSFVADKALMGAGRYQDMEVTFTAKAPTMALSSESLAVLSSAAMMRTYCFAAQDVNHLHHEVVYTRGYPNPRLPKYVLDRRAKGALVVDVPASTLSKTAAEEVLARAVMSLTSTAHTAA